jgi:hypothetical protein
VGSRRSALCRVAAQWARLSFVHLSNGRNRFGDSEDISPAPPR